MMSVTGNLWNRRRPSEVNATTSTRPPNCSNVLRFSTSPPTSGAGAAASDRTES